MNKFEEQQQILIDDFKSKISIIASETISRFYTDVTRYAEIDAHTNFTEMLKDELRYSIVDEVATKYSHYSWAHDIRMKLLTNYKEQLSNKIIEDLQDQVRCLNAHIDQMNKNRY